MHEIEMASKIIHVIEKESEKLHFSKIKSVEMKVGRMNGLDKSHFYDALKAENSDRTYSLEFKIDEIDVELECSKCGHRYIDTRFEDHDFAHTTSHAPHLYMPPPCPSCKGEGARMISGTEMKIVSIDGE